MFACTFDICIKLLLTYYLLKCGGLNSPLGELSPPMPLLVLAPESVAGTWCEHVIE